MSRKELLDRLEHAAVDLEVVRLPMVFVGGATMPLYIDEAAGEIFRETLDIDVMVDGSYAEFAALEEGLRAAGFRQDVGVGSPRCRWFKDGRTYDIVDVRTDHPDDRWTRPTGDGLQARTLPSGRTILVLAPGRFLAAKIAALTDRGGPRWYESSDFEDIVLILESHPQLQPWLADTPREAVLAVASWAQAATRRSTLREEIEATVTRGPGLESRVEAVLDRLFWLAFAWPGSEP